MGTTGFLFYVAGYTISRCFDFEMIKKEFLSILQQCVLNGALCLMGYIIGYVVKNYTVYIIIATAVAFLCLIVRVLTQVCYFSIWCLIGMCPINTIHKFVKQCELEARTSMPPLNADGDRVMNKKLSYEKVFLRHNSSRLLFHQTCFTFRCGDCDCGFDSDDIVETLEVCESINRVRVYLRRYSKYVDFDLYISPKRVTRLLWVKLIAVVKVYIQWLKFIKRYYRPIYGVGYIRANKHFDNNKRQDVETTNKIEFVRP